MTGDTFDFIQGNVVTSSAQMADPSATTGDVLTVNADKSISAAAGGGSSPITFVDVTVTPDTVDIDLADGGAVVYTPEAGERILGLTAISVTAAFNGTDPRLGLMAQGDDPETGQNLMGISADADQMLSAHVNGMRTVAAGQNGGDFYMTDTTPLVVTLYADGTFGPTGSTVGEAIVRLVIGAAPS